MKKEINEILWQELKEENDYKKKLWCKTTTELRTESYVL
jgi:hypothetical protein